MKILHIDSSILASASVSRQLSQALVSQLQQKYPAAQVDYLDLAQTEIAHLTQDILMGKNPQQAALGEQLLQQYLNADIVVVGAAMYNFGLSSNLKAWVDRISVAGRSFKYTEQGPVGLADVKTAYIVSSRGGVYGEDSPVDFQESFLNTIFNFTGVKDIQVIRAEGVAMGDSVKQQAIDQALAQIQAV